MILHGEPFEMRLVLSCPNVKSWIQTYKFSVLSRVNHYCPLLPCYLGNSFVTTENNTLPAVWLPKCTLPAEPPSTAFWLKIVLLAGDRNGSVYQEKRMLAPGLDLRQVARFKSITNNQFVARTHSRNKVRDVLPESEFYLVEILSDKMSWKWEKVLRYSGTHCLISRYDLYPIHIISVTYCITLCDISIRRSKYVPWLLFSIPSLQILDLETVACHVASGTRVSRYLRCERPCVDLSHTLTFPVCP